MTRAWRLTPLARESLVEIALWTIDTFGEAQAGLYESELIDRCEAIAEGRVDSRDCSILVDVGDDVGLRYTRAGEHFVVYLDEPDEVVIIDFLHSRSDLPARIAALHALLRQEGLPQVSVDAPASSAAATATPVLFRCAAQILPAASASCARMARISRSCTSTACSHRSLLKMAM